MGWPSRRSHWPGRRRRVGALDEFIEPLRMPITRIANSIIDGVLPDPAPVAAEIVRYSRARTALLPRRRPRALVDQQAAAWDPVLSWFRDERGARLILSQGVMFVEQPAPALAAVAAALPAGDGWRIARGACRDHPDGSALLALALLHGFRDRDAVWSRPMSTRTSRSPNGARTPRRASAAPSAAASSTPRQRCSPLCDTRRNGGRHALPCSPVIRRPGGTP